MKNSKDQEIPSGINESQMLFAILISSALLGTNPPDAIPPPLITRVARIELNHVLCYETGEPRFTQLILWGWDERRKTHHVVAWKMVEPDYGRQIRREGREWVDRTRDGTRDRETRSGWLYERWSTYDIELDDREKLPQDQRAGLTRPIEQPP